MAVVKITDKKVLEEIQAKLMLRLGHKISQQRIIDLCIKYASENLDVILHLAAQQPQLTPEKAEMIIQEIENSTDVPYDQNAHFANPDDEDIYNF